MVIHVDNNGVQHNIKEIRRKNKILPDGVELYKYIQSSGTQYIDSGWVTDYTKSFEITSKYNASSTGTRGCILSSYSAARATSLEVTTSSRFWLHDGNKDNSITANVGVDHISVFSYGGGIWKHQVDGGTAQTGSASYSDSAAASAYIFLDRALRTSTFNKLFKIYYLTIKENKVLVRNFLPCTYYGEPGMWDSVNNKFYGNIGTGTFVLGPKLNLEEYEYLQGSGSSTHISTGLTTKSNVTTKYSFGIKLGAVQSGSQWFGALSGSYFGVDTSGKWGAGGVSCGISADLNYHDVTVSIKTTTSSQSIPIQIDDVTASSTRSDTVAADRPISIFVIGGSQNSYYLSSGSKIYYCKIFEDDILVRNFVPCTCNEIPGMWDKVEMKFYPNAGTGTFVLGPSKKYSKIHQIRKTKRLLPNGVELYEYIESTGTQHIDTGVIPDNNTQTNIKYQYTDTGNLNLFGSYDTSSKAYIVNIYNNKLEYNYYNSRWVSDINVTRGEVINLNFNKNNKIYVNGTQVKSLSTNSFTETRTVYIFSRNGGTASAHYKGKIYHFQMLQNGVLIRNMLPCTYYEEPGMWDTVENKFYSNAGTGNFILGQKLNLKQYEYLESTGTQWIDTGVYGYMNHTYEIEFQQNDTGNYRLWGVLGQSSYVGYNMSLTYGGGWMTRWSSTSSGENSVSLSSIDTDKHKFKIINGLNYFDDISKGTSSGHNTDFSIDHNLFLFTINPAGATPTTNAKAKIYSYKDIDVNNNLIRDMVPCTCNEVPGLWDKVEWKFYGNSGTGQFNLGNMNYYGIINLDITDDYYNNKYFTITALKNGSITFTYGSTVSTTLAEYLEYSSNNGQTWTRITNVDNSSVSETINVTKGQRIIWRGINSTFTIAGTEPGSCFSCTEVDVSGNIMSLLYGDNFKQQTTLTNEYTFAQLFNFCEIYNAKDLVLPATTITNYCYVLMFEGCEHLITPPKTLPALTAQEECYSGMFYDCSSLKVTPQLPATSLARRCYYQMFRGCTSLTVVTDLLATTLGTRSYEQMFYGCSSLVNAQSSLPAMSLGTYCYQAMFYNCSSLVNVPTLPATNIANGAYGAMFQNCTSLITAPELPALTLRQSCYANMFRGCSKLNYVKCLATSISASSCTNNWLDGVASTGTFVKNSSMSGWTTGVSGIPSGWTVQNA